MEQVLLPLDTPDKRFKIVSAKKEKKILTPEEKIPWRKTTYLNFLDKSKTQRMVFKKKNQRQKKSKTRDMKQQNKLIRSLENYTKHHMLYMCAM